MSTRRRCDTFTGQEALAEVIAFMRTSCHRQQPTDRHGSQALQNFYFSALTLWRAVLCGCSETIPLALKSTLTLPRQCKPTPVRDIFGRLSLCSSPLPQSYLMWGQPGSQSTYGMHVTHLTHRCCLLYSNLHNTLCDAMMDLFLNARIAARLHLYLTEA